MRAYPTSAISVSTAGQATAIIGNWADGVWGLREELVIQVLSERSSDSGELGIIAHMRGDFQIQRDAGFEILTVVTT